MAKPILFGISRKKLYQVWWAASQLSFQMENITVRKLVKVGGLSSTSVVGTGLKALVALGYMGRGPRATGGSWHVIVPLILQSEMKDPIEVKGEVS